MSRLAAFVPLACVVLAPSCATMGSEGVGDLDLPSAGMGPFRKLAAEEVPGVAPFVLDDRNANYREPAVLAEGRGALLYVVATVNGVDVIVRSRALDGRAFFGTTTNVGNRPSVVLGADAAWEGGGVSGPSVMRRGSEIWLYYAAAGGIGLARSTDGLTFQKQSAPVLARDASSAWETNEVHAPGVYALPDGRIRLLYAAGAAIGEAESADGVHFTRLDPNAATREIEPVLGPSARPVAGALAPNEKPPFDTATVGDPCVAPRFTPGGRYHVRVLYTGTDDAGVTTVGFAARYGETGMLWRQRLPAYAVNLKERAPAYLELADEGVPKSLLYVAQEHSGLGEKYPAIAAAFAPANLALPPPADFPDGP